MRHRARSMSRLVQKRGRKVQEVTRPPTGGYGLCLGAGLAGQPGADRHNFPPMFKATSWDVTSKHQTENLACSRTSRFLWTLKFYRNESAWFSNFPYFSQRLDGGKVSGGSGGFRETGPRVAPESDQTGALHRQLGVPVGTCSSHSSPVHEALQAE